VSPTLGGYMVEYVIGEFTSECLHENLSIQAPPILAVRTCGCLLVTIQYTDHALVWGLFTYHNLTRTFLPMIYAKGQLACKTNDTQPLLMETCGHIPRT